MKSILALCLLTALAQAQAPLRWWKGNLHTHTLWSDGDDYPEMVIQWYKEHGYHFLALSDHNVFQNIEKWIEVKTTNATAVAALEKYRAKFGQDVQEKEVSGHHLVRLQSFRNFAHAFHEPNHFLMIPSEEITDQFNKAPVHMNATNLKGLIKPQGGTSIADVIQRNLDAVLQQRTLTGQPMFAHLNHPNFGWAISPEDFAQVKSERFFEVYNGHPGVHNEGDARRVSMDRLWDLVLTSRLEEGNREPLYGMATDDAHHYHEQATNRSNAGRGWVVVQSRALDARDLVRAMEDGKFYASSGVALKSITPAPDRLTIEIIHEPGVTYRTEFIGSKKRVRPDGPVKLRPYADAGVGQILAEVGGTSATYRLKDDDLYVRARITSSKPKTSSYRPDEKETAWTQPVVSK